MTLHRYQESLAQRWFGRKKQRFMVEKCFFNKKNQWFFGGVVHDMVVTLNYTTML